MGVQLFIQNQLTGYLSSGREQCLEKEEEGRKKYVLIMPSYTCEHTGWRMQATWSKTNAQSNTPERSEACKLCVGTELSAGRIHGMGTGIHYWAF